MAFLWQELLTTNQTRINSTKILINTSTNSKCSKMCGFNKIDKSTKYYNKKKRKYK